VVLSQLSDASGPLATGVTRIEFNFYAVDNTQGQMRDPFDGINPFTDTDDFLTPAFVSPLVWEIDVLGTESRPRLQAELAGADLQLTWHSLSDNAVIQAARQLAAPDWADLEPQPIILRDGEINTARVPINGGQWFFRLRFAP
jgi:hypothetical protein